MIQILIIGAGQLGSRHLQALNLVTQPVFIHLVDPSTVSIEHAIEIFNSSGGKHPVKSYLSIEEIDLFSADVAIIATNSVERRNVIEKLVSQIKINYLILEKFLFPELKDYGLIQTLLESKSIKTWVNCPRRMFQTYKEIKEEMGQTSVISISGSGWGLGCNGIHMLDLVAFLTGENKMILHPDLIDLEIIKSKRQGYIEFTGKITGHTASKRHNFTIASYADTATPFIIYIQSGKKNYIISEGMKKLILLDASLPVLNAVEKEVVTFYQSELTNIVVEQIISTGTCDLTSYHESAFLHKQFLELLLNFMTSQSGNQVEKCIIT